MFGAAFFTYASKLYHSTHEAAVTANGGSERNDFCAEKLIPESKPTFRCSARGENAAGGRLLEESAFVALVPSDLLPDASWY